MMLEGTEKYPGFSFTQEAESYGMSFDATPGSLGCTMLSEDTEKGFELMSEMLQNAIFKEEDFDRIKEKTKAHLIQFWDTPKRSVNQVVAQEIYKGHPYSKMILGTEQTLDAISRDQAYEFYKKVTTPKESVLVVVGNFDKNKIKSQIEQEFSGWTGSAIADLEYPKIVEVENTTIDIFKNRDQVVLAFAGLSVDRLNPDFDALQIFTQLLSGSMNSYLFALREQTGLFYTISGSLVLSSDKQPGMIFVKTIVSKDRLEEAQKVILDCLKTSIDMVQEADFDEAKEMVINNFPAMFETIEDTAQSFLFLEKYNLSSDYLSKKIETIRAMKLEEMKSIVKKYLQINKLLTVRIGRV
jgi:zinc protease